MWWIFLELSVGGWGGGGILSLQENIIVTISGQNEKVIQGPAFFKSLNIGDFSFCESLRLIQCNRHA